MTDDEIETWARFILLAVVQEIRIAHVRNVLDADALRLEGGDGRGALEDGGDEVQYVGGGVLGGSIGILRRQGADLEGGLVGLDFGVYHPAVLRVPYVAAADESHAAVADLVEIGRGLRI